MHMGDHSSEANFYSHLEAHIGEKPSIWNDHERAFSESSFLQSHVLIHTGDKPYECHLCAKALHEDMILVII